MAGIQLPTPVIGNKAHQLHTFQFPQHEFGKTFLINSTTMAYLFVS